ncbi:MAG: hypothetical protein KJ922_03005, partial [Nanoarchaeota archaeon]|nr:hypothetical protein [Nanoarchaeota archaeon]
MIDLNNFPEVEDVDTLAIAVSDFDPKNLDSITSAFDGNFEHPFKATPDMVAYAAKIAGDSDMGKLESLAELLGEQIGPIQKGLRFLGSKPVSLGTYYDEDKLETRNARELFEYSMEHGKVPLVCMEYTLLVLALGNAMGLKVGASEVSTNRETNGKAVEGTADRRREHIVPVVYIKKENGKYAAVGVEIPEAGKKT